MTLTEDSLNDENPQLGFVAVHPESNTPFYCDDDAVVILNKPDVLREFILTATGEAAPEGTVQKAFADEVLDQLFAGVAVAFDQATYERFLIISDEEGFEAPEFNEIAIEVEGYAHGLLGILELDAEEADGEAAAEGLVDMANLADAHLGLHDDEDDGEDPKDKN